MESTHADPSRLQMYKNNLLLCLWQGKDESTVISRQSVGIGMRCRDVVISRLLPAVDFRAIAVRSESFSHAAQHTLLKGDVVFCCWLTGGICR